MIGVTVGKFNPPHLGHLFLIEQAANEVDRLFVVVADRRDQTLPASQRAEWLRADVPANVEIVVTPDDLPDAPEPWAQRVLDLLAYRPDVAFTSEPYGAAWAAAIGCGHGTIDLERRRFPISGTAVRADLAGSFTSLIPSARADLARRVVLVGSESTGKTTMATALAEYFSSVWVPEVGRWYWEGRRYLTDQSWTSDEFVRIAEGQVRLDKDLARKAAAGVMFADTDPLVTGVWHHRYLGSLSPVVEDVAAGHRPTHYLVCTPDFPWHQDGSRESELHREEMHERTCSAVEASGVPWTLLTGSHESRLHTATAVVDELRTFPQLT